MKLKSSLLMFITISLSLTLLLSGCIDYDKPNQTPLEIGENQETENDYNDVEPEDTNSESQETGLNQDKNQNKTDKDKEEKPDLVVNPKPKVEKKQVNLYFMDKEIVETGQGNYDELIKETRTIDGDNNLIGEKIVEELQKGPQSEKALSLIKKDLKIINVEIAEDTAYVNFSSKNLHGGSLEETGIILQIGYSLTELDDVNKVQFLVDGSKKESLMGHLEIKEAWTRN